MLSAGQIDGQEITVTAVLTPTVRLPPRRLSPPRRLPPPPPMWRRTPPRMRRRSAGDYVRHCWARWHGSCFTGLCCVTLTRDKFPVGRGHPGDALRSAAGLGLPDAAVIAHAPAPTPLARD